MTADDVGMTEQRCKGHVAAGVGAAVQACGGHVAAALHSQERLDAALGRLAAELDGILEGLPMPVMPPCTTRIAAMQRRVHALTSSLSRIHLTQSAVIALLRCRGEYTPSPPRSHASTCVFLPPYLLSSSLPWVLSRLKEHHSHCCDAEESVRPHLLPLSHSHPHRDNEKRPSLSQRAQGTTIR
ncbi:unnamed protein product [Closterium sp. Yama58-4]|nr:unnamed protein product [Closterium sp. Yama58-4]